MQDTSGQPKNLALTSACACMGLNPNCRGALLSLLTCKQACLYAPGHLKVQFEEGLIYWYCQRFMLARSLLNFKTSFRKSPLQTAQYLMEYSLVPQSFASNKLNRSIPSRRDHDFVKQSFPNSVFLLVSGRQVGYRRSTEQEGVSLLELAWFSLQDISQVGIAYTDDSLNYETNGEYCAHVFTNFPIVSSAYLSPSRKFSFIFTCVCSEFGIIVANLLVVQSLYSACKFPQAAQAKPSRHCCWVSRRMENGAMQLILLHCGRHQ